MTSDEQRDLDGPVERHGSRRKWVHVIALLLVLEMAVVWWLWRHPGEMSFFSFDFSKNTKRFAGIDFVWIEPGSFQMGLAGEAEDACALYGGNVGWYRGEAPQHTATLSRGFWLSKYEITKGQWREVMGEEDLWQGRGWILGRGRSPAVYVTWFDVQDFIETLNERGEGKFRLPTEAEWEYACRAGTTSHFSFGNDAERLPKQAWYKDNADLAGEEYAHVVGRKKANPWGLYDMHGNVWEWCEDWWGAPYSEGPVTDPQGPDNGTGRVIRGGSWLSFPWALRSSNRSSLDPMMGNAGVGFRLCRDP